MKTKLLNRYFHGSFFMNEVILSAFLQKPEWKPGELMHLVAAVAVILKAPPMTGTSAAVVNFHAVGWATLEGMGESSVLRLSDTGLELASKLQPLAEISEAIKVGMQQIKRFREFSERKEAP